MTAELIRDNSDAMGMMEQFRDRSARYYSALECRFAHGKPNGDFEYCKDEDMRLPIRALEAFREFGEKVCFLGHTHVPYSVVKKGDSTTMRYFDYFLRTPIKLEEGVRAIVNVGSVGSSRMKLKHILGGTDISFFLDRPELNIDLFRDIALRAKYVIYDVDQSTIYPRCVEYDYGSAYSNSISCGMPYKTAERVCKGVDKDEVNEMKRRSLRRRLLLDSRDLCASMRV
jgi:hypothetical protein